MKNIIIADDHYVVRVGTSIIIESEFNEVKIFYAEKYTQVLDLLRTTKIDLIILDINMPESKYIEMISEIKSINAQVKILVFSVYEENIAIQYIMSGADGYLNKLSDESEIINAIKNIFEIGNYFPNKILDKIIKYARNEISTNPFENLTQKEFKIFELLMNGNGNLEISNILDLKKSTISTHKKRIFEKLNVKSIPEMINLYNEIKYKN